MGKANLSLDQQETVRVTPFCARMKVVLAAPEWLCSSYNIVNSSFENSSPHYDDEISDGYNVIAAG